MMTNMNKYSTLHLLYPPFPIPSFPFFSTTSKMPNALFPQWPSWVLGKCLTAFFSLFEGRLSFFSLSPHRWSMSWARQRTKQTPSTQLFCCCVVAHMEPHARWLHFIQMLVCFYMLLHTTQKHFQHGDFGVYMFWKGLAFSELLIHIWCRMMNKT